MVVRDYYFVAADMECCCFHRLTDFGFLHLPLLPVCLLILAPNSADFCGSYSNLYVGGLDTLQVGAMFPDLPALVLLEHACVKALCFSLPVCDDGIFDLRVVPFLLLPDICLLF